MKVLVEQAEKIFEALSTGEVALAFDLYPSFIEVLLGRLDEQSLIALEPLLSEMLKAQEQGNVVWLTDLIGYLLIPRLEDPSPPPAL